MGAGSRWQRVDGSAAEHYDRHLVPAMFAPWAPRLVDLAAVRSDDRVLDVACGTGVVTRVAAGCAGPTGWAVGIDINPAMLSVARSVAPGSGAPIAWVAADALRLPIPDASYDVALCQHGLQQIPDRPAALVEMRRVLRPGGRLAASVWSELAGSPGMAALVAALERHAGAEAANNRRVPFGLGDLGLLRSLVESAGFLEIEIYTLVEFASFPSPEDLVAYQLAATPLSTLGTLTEERRLAIERDVRDALQGYLNGKGGLRVPMTAHLVRARA
jgi:SAM-dependent methyltransferase